MSAPNHPQPHTETLANGLQVSLCHAPHLQRCAATLQLHVGGHDVPLAWPERAQELERLMLLGTERFVGAHALSAYVQSEGGQVHAKTDEHGSTYAFELPPAAFAGGLERLCDMLAHPRLAENDQRLEQQALREFHQRFYQAGHMSLSLTGPQPVEELRALAERYSAGLAQSGARQAPDANPLAGADIEPPRAGLIRGQTSKHRGLRTFAQDRSRGRRDQ